MRDDDCVTFLQWALPELRMRWPGFRKVRTQVCKRIGRRIEELALDGVTDYQGYLQTHSDEWSTLDALSRVTISRFYRDKLMFKFLEQEVLPGLAQDALDQDDNCLKVWCAGFGSGEEPYTLMLIWKLKCQARFPDMELQLIATDADPNMRQRATRASYQYGSIKNLPESWREQVFIQREEEFKLKPEYKHGIQFIVQDVRESMPEEKFDLILCRNLVFTYYDEALQIKVLERMKNVLKDDGVLVIGIHENLPAGVTGFDTLSDKFRIYRKSN